MPINRPFIRLQLLSSIKDSTHSLGHCTGNKIHPHLSFLRLVPLCCNSQLKSSRVQGKESDFFLIRTQLLKQFQSMAETSPGMELGKSWEFVHQPSQGPRSHAGNETTKKFLRSALSTTHSTKPRPGSPESLTMSCKIHKS